MDPLELLLHPVRLRIVHALSGTGRTVTTAQLCARLPDVSQATVYRHVGLLADAGIIEVAGEQRMRGFVERSYRLVRSRAVVDAATAASATVDDHRRAFATATAVLLAEFGAYLAADGADPARDMVGYRQHAIWLTDEERDRLIAGLREAILPVLANEPADGRAPYLLSPILFPLPAE
ncbi:helix-turn-helix domain-containing protein [Paractinoplanes ferrugineus]|uniref:Transcriptional regulator n=1 Tax=Paractinoplanes ferrugineus TaxID=113564 RepID=A0A919J0F8_9ACTN|nr:helix-turn-helix domain-containing protein [Actinoplanes ferrugineus]GIE11444.1 transcriptional regulator [Actinoplanes ferrugineus]